LFKVLYIANIKKMFSKSEVQERSSTEEVKRLAWAIAQIPQIKEQISYITSALKT